MFPFFSSPSPLPAVEPVDEAALVQLGKRSGLDELGGLSLGHARVALGEIVKNGLDRALHCVGLRRHLPSVMAPRFFHGVAVLAAHEFRKKGDRLLFPRLEEVDAADDGPHDALSEIGMLLDKRAPCRQRGALVFDFQIVEINEKIHPHLSRGNRCRRRDHGGRDLAGLERRPHHLVRSEIDERHVLVGIEAQMAERRARVFLIGVARPLETDNLSF